MSEIITNTIWNAYKLNIVCQKFWIVTNKNQIGYYFQTKKVNEKNMLFTELWVKKCIIFIWLNWISIKINEFDVTD